MSKQIRQFQGTPRREICLWMIIIAIFVGGVFVHWNLDRLLMWYFHVDKSLKPAEQSQELAHHGEAYIAFHSFFDMLAWLAVASALLLQWRDMRHRDFHSVFFPYLTLFQNYIDDLECGSARGRHVLSMWKNSLKGWDDDAGLKRLQADYGPALEYYHRHLSVLLRFIGWAPISCKEKNKYLDLLHAQLSFEELFLHAAFRRSVAGEDLKQLEDGLGSKGLALDFLTQTPMEHGLSEWKPASPPPG